MNKLFLATGIVGGLVIVYGIQKKYTWEEIQEKFEDLKEEFKLIIEDLVELGLELLERVYNFINEWIKVIIFKAEKFVHEMRVKLV